MTTEICDFTQGCLLGSWLVASSQPKGSLLSSGGPLFVLADRVQWYILSAGERKKALTLGLAVTR